MAKHFTYFLFTVFPLFLWAQGNPKNFKGIEGCFHKTISVQVYLVQDENEQVNVPTNDFLNLFTELNAFFAPICVQFEVCAIDTIPNLRQDSIVVGVTDEELVELYHVPNKINLYFVQQIIGSAHPCGQALLGDTITPNINPLRDAIFYSKDCLIESRHFIRTFGYYFGLNFTIGDGLELVDGSNCAIAGDRICDTAADPNGAVGPNCNYTGQSTDANGDYYMPQVCNIMSFYNVTCPYFFTNGQYNRMLNILKSGRNYLW